MVSAISSYDNNYMSYLQTARIRPDPAELFNTVDADGSGGVSQSELDTFVKDLSGKTGKSIDASGAVAKYDTNSDGVLSQDELKSFMEATMAPPSGVMGMGHHHGHHGGLFKAIDTDSSGSISQDELEQWAETISSETGDTIDTTDAISTYDVDGDGKLSRKEFGSFMEASGIKPPPPPAGGLDAASGVSYSGAPSTASAESIISEYDTNGDGVLSSDELQGYLDNSETASYNTLVQQAISAYAMNFGSSMSADLEDALLSFGGASGYNPVDLFA